MLAAQSLADLAVGFNPQFVDTLGKNVPRTQRRNMTMSFSADNSDLPLARMTNASRTRTVYPVGMTRQLPLAPTAWAACLQGAPEYLCPSGVFCVC